VPPFRCHHRAFAQQVMAGLVPAISLRKAVPA
jgi:hypothetical protein